MAIKQIVEIVTPKTAYDFSNRDAGRIVGDVARDLATKSAYFDVVTGGIFEDGLVEGSILGDDIPSEKIPAADPKDQCGSAEYITPLGYVRGEGKKIKIKAVSLSAFQKEYTEVQDDLKKRMFDVLTADLRSVLFTRSGFKIKLDFKAEFKNMCNGGFQEIDVPFKDGREPSSALTFAFVKYAVDNLIERLLVEPFEAADFGTAVKFISSVELRDKLFSELNVKVGDREYASEHNINGEKEHGYVWQGPFRGILFGEDSTPLRFNTFTLDDEGQVLPAFIEPKINVNQRTSEPEWADNPVYEYATYEIAFLCFSDSFQKLVLRGCEEPKGWDIPRQFDPGEIEFVVIRDNQENKYGDIGQHIFQSARAYRPIRPHAIVPIAFQRVVPAEKIEEVLCQEKKAQ
jgi:hypothetical protein